MWTKMPSEEAANKILSGMKEATNKLKLAILSLVQ